MIPLSKSALLSLSTLLFCAACAPLPLSDVKSPDSLTVPSKSYALPYQAAPLDRVSLTKKTGEVSVITITNDRKLEYPAGQTWDVTNKTPAQVIAHIKAKDESIVSVRYEEFRANRVALTGEVNIQTHLDLQDAPIRVIDAIAAAGGFTPLANLRRVRLMRQNAGHVEVYELNMKDVMHGRNMQGNMLLQAGDAIYVPRTLL